MKTFPVSLDIVQKSGRLDFDFFNPSQEQEISLAKGYTTDLLGNLCLKLTTGKTAPRNSYPDVGVRIVKVKNVRGSGINWGERFFVTKEFYESAARKAQIQEGDILMLCSAHNKVYIGRVDIVNKFPAEVRQDGDRCMCVGELIIIRGNPELVLPEYLITYLRLPVIQERIRKMVKGQTAHLYPKDLAQLEVVIPPREVQEELAEMNMTAEQDYITRIRRAEDDLANTRRLIKNVILTGVQEDLGITPAEIEAGSSESAVDVEP